jgi:hypothetical protein
VVPGGPRRRARRAAAPRRREPGRVPSLVCRSRDRPACSLPGSSDAAGRDRALLRGTGARE